MSDAFASVRMYPELEQARFARRWAQRALVEHAGGALDDAGLLKKPLAGFAADDDDDVLPWARTTLGGLLPVILEAAQLKEGARAIEKLARIDSAADLSLCAAVLNETAALVDEIATRAGFSVPRFVLAGVASSMRATAAALSDDAVRAGSAAVDAARAPGAVRALVHIDPATLDDPERALAACVQAGERGAEVERRRIERDMASAPLA